MGVKHFEELRAWQFAHEFKLEVYRLFNASPAAAKDFRYRDQAFDAASAIESDIGEGFTRRGARVFSLFLTYALASLAEAQLRLRDGIDRGYFTEPDCQRALSLGLDCGRATLNLKTSLEPFLGSSPPSPRPSRRNQPGRSPKGRARRSRRETGSPAGGPKQ